MNSRLNILKCKLLCSWLGHKFDRVWGKYPQGYVIMQCSRCWFAEHHVMHVLPWSTLWRIQ